MADHRDAPQSIDDLLREARATRESIHALVARMRQERQVWERSLTQLTRRTRLTERQRQCLRAGFRAARTGRRGSC